MRLHSKWMLKQTVRQKEPHTIEVTQVLSSPGKCNTTQETVIFTRHGRPYSQDMQSFKASYAPISTPEC